MNEVVVRGRDPELLLSDVNCEGEVSLKSVQNGEMSYLMRWKRLPCFR